MVRTDATIGRGKSTHQYRALNRFTVPNCFALPGGPSQCPITHSVLVAISPDLAPLRRQLSLYPSDLVGLIRT